MSSVLWGTDCDVTRKLDDSSTIFIFDAKTGSGARQPVVVKAFTVVRTSNNESMKQTRWRNALNLTYTSSSLGDMMHTGKYLHRDPADVRMCFKAFGPSMRLLFGMSFSDAQGFIVEAVSKLSVDNLVSLTGELAVGIVPPESGVPTVLFSVSLCADTVIDAELDLDDSHFNALNSALLEKDNIISIVNAHRDLALYSGRYLCRVFSIDCYWVRGAMWVGLFLQRRFMQVSNGNRLFGELCRALGT